MYGSHETRRSVNVQLLVLNVNRHTGILLERNRHMPTKEQVRDQVLKWLSEVSIEQEWTIRSNDEDPYYYFVVGVIDKNRIIRFKVCIERIIERIIIMNNVEFAKPNGIDYRLTPEKGRYWIDLRIHSMQLGIDVQAIPDVENMKGIQVRKMIYFDGLSQDKFMDGLLTILNSSDLADILFKRFSMDMQGKLKKD